MFSNSMKPPPIASPASFTLDLSRALPPCAGHFPQHQNSRQQQAVSAPNYANASIYSSSPAAAGFMQYPNTAASIWPNGQMSNQQTQHWPTAQAAAVNYPLLPSLAPPGFTPNGLMEMPKKMHFAEEEGADGNRKQRVLFSKEQIWLLESTFREHKFINPAQRRELARRCGLHSDQVKIWFQNRRYKQKKKDKDAAFMARNNINCKGKRGASSNGVVLPPPPPPPLPSPPPQSAPPMNPQAPLPAVPNAQQFGPVKSEMKAAANLPAPFLMLNNHNNIMNYACCPANPQFAAFFGHPQFWHHHYHNQQQPQLQQHQQQHS